MFKDMIKTLKKRDKKEILALRIYREGSFKENLNNFIIFLIKYFDIEAINKKYEDDDEIISRDFLFESHLEELNYLEYILKELKRFLPLIFKISQDYWLVDKLEKSNLTNESIIKILENFVSLERTGRKRLFYKFEREEFQQFKKKYRKIIDCAEFIESQENPIPENIANAIKYYDLKKKDLEIFVRDFSFLQERASTWSRATKYRFDREFPKILKSFYWIKMINKNYDFYMKILKDNSKEKVIFNKLKLNL